MNTKNSNQLIQYGVMAMRTNGERVYFCEDSNGEHMTPYAASFAAKFNSKLAAKRNIARLSGQWAGLLNWSVFQDI